MQPGQFPGRFNRPSCNVYPYRVLKLYHWFLWKQSWGFPVLLVKFYCAGFGLSFQCAQRTWIINTIVWGGSYHHLLHPSPAQANPTLGIEIDRSVEIHREICPVRRPSRSMASAGFLQCACRSLGLQCSEHRPTPGPRVLVPAAPDVAFLRPSGSEHRWRRWSSLWMTSWVLSASRCKQAHFPRKLRLMLKAT